MNSTQKVFNIHKSSAVPGSCWYPSAKWVTISRNEPTLRKYTKVTCANRGIPGHFRVLGRYTRPFL